MPRTNLLTRLVPGAKLTVIGHDWHPESPMIGRVYTVSRVVGGRVFVTEGGRNTRIDLPYTDRLEVIAPDTFRVALDTACQAWVTYRTS